MNTAYDAASADLEYTDLDPAQCPDGVLATGVATLAETSFCDVGVWEHPAGRSTDVEADEVFVVLSGRGRVVFSDGRELELRPGTVGVLQAGAETTWIVSEALRKVWITPR
ncbi:MAG: DUF861 domain-containing protein [Actinomycetales bacterium]|nr:DUF861 domain-containing protein [Actinomycetales bacterium]